MISARSAVIKSSGSSLAENCVYNFVLNFAFFCGIVILKDWGNRIAGKREKTKETKNEKYRGFKRTESALGFDHTHGTESAEGKFDAGGGEGTEERKTTRVYASNRTQK